MKISTNPVFPIGTRLSVCEPNPEAGLFQNDVAEVVKVWDVDTTGSHYRLHLKLYRPKYDGIDEMYAIVSREECGKQTSFNVWFPAEQPMKKHDRSMPSAIMRKILEPPQPGTIRMVSTVNPRFSYYPCGSGICAEMIVQESAPGNSFVNMRISGDKTFTKADARKVTWLRVQEWLGEVGVVEFKNDKQGVSRPYCAQRFSETPKGISKVQEPRVFMEVDKVPEGLRVNALLKTRSDLDRLESTLEALRGTLH